MITDKQCIRRAELAKANGAPAPRYEDPVLDRISIAAHSGYTSPTEGRKEDETMTTTLYHDAEGDLSAARLLPHDQTSEQRARWVESFRRAFQSRARALGWEPRDTGGQSVCVLDRDDTLEGADRREREERAWQQCHDLLTGPGPRGGWTQAPVTPAMRRQFGPR